MVGLGADKKLSTPLPAIVGQDRLKRALLALAVEDGLSGTLIRGEKGTAKSTAVRAVADLLPEQRVVADCPYGCPPAEAADDPSVRCESCRERDDPPVETRPTPVVTLPLGATRDRVVGTLSVEDALGGEAEFDPGLLARANRGILYVDEVNLLDDHLVDVILDAAAAGVNRVERDGVSRTHPADITLVGTMNPEEGDLRPQLRDRFDLCVDVAGLEDVDDRVAIIDQVVDGDGPEGTADVEATTADRREQVHRARELDPEIPTEFKRTIAELCVDAGVDGHRADFAIARAARALAALDGRDKVLESDVHEAAGYALAHRMQSQPFEDAPDAEEVIDDHLDGDEEGDASEDDPEEADGEGDNGGETENTEADGPENGDGGEPEPGDDPTVDGDSEDDGARNDETDASGGGDGDGDGDGDDTETDEPSPGDASGEQTPESQSAELPDDADDRGDGDDAGDGDDPGDDEGGGADDEADEDAAPPLVPGAARAEVGEATAPDVEPPDTSQATTNDGIGRGEATPSTEGRGARVRTESVAGDERSTGSIDAASTVRSAAREGRSTPTDEDLRQSVRTDSARTLTVFVTDASASMAPAMRAAKGVVVDLLRDAYAERDEVALVAFGGDDAETLLPPTTSVSLAARHLKELPSADRTPLPAGLDAAAELLATEDPDGALVVLVTDGRANVADGSPTTATREAARRLAAVDAEVLVVDAGESRAGLLDVVCEATDATRVPLAALSAETVLDGWE
ncbi:VWA domain-containing protein [Haloparvum sp. AD34]